MSSSFSLGSYLIYWGRGGFGAVVASDLKIDERDGCVLVVAGPDGSSISRRSTLFLA